MNSRFPTFLGLAILMAASAYAETPADFPDACRAETRRTELGLTASALCGEPSFRRVDGKEWSCSTRHTDNPAAIGKH